MERVMYKILIEQKRLDIPRRFSNYEVEEILRKENVQEIMKFAVDNKYAKCSIATDPDRDVDFFCYFDLNETVTLGSPLFNYDDVRISIDDANVVYFTTEELRDLGYEPTSPNEDDFFRDVRSKDLKEELLKYIKELENRMESELQNPSISDPSFIENTRNDKLQTDILLEYLEEEME